jgi:hypothetical protein
MQAGYGILAAVLQPGCGRGLRLDNSNEALVDDGSLFVGLRIHE